MTINVLDLIQKLEAIRDKVHGCGNGRNEIEKFIKQLKADYGL